MPISDEIIELAPVNKTKKLLIVMFVAMGLLLALAVVFLVLYLIKPSVEESHAAVKDISITSTTLFSRVEDGTEVRYASIGVEYEIKADIAVENGASDSISWDVEPQNAISVKSQQNSDGAYIKFVPNAGFNGTNVTIKARASSNVDKVAEVKFKVVFQGAEQIEFPYYYVTTDSTKHLNITDDTIEIPYYSTGANNKQFAVMIVQRGKYDETTGEYSDLSYKSGEGVVKVTVESGTSVTVGSVSAAGFYFSAKSTGDTTLKIVANDGTDDAPNVERKLKVSVKAPAAYGCAENVYFFDKAVVDGAFIESVLDGGRISTEKLNAAVKGKGVTLNPKEITLPYGAKYTDIYKHILLDPISLQYDTEKHEFKEKWEDKITVASSNDSVIKKSNTTSGIQLTADGLAGTVKDSAKCTLSFTDKTEGSAHVSRDVAVRVVARSSDGGHTVTVGGKEVTTDVVSVSAGGSAQVAVTYNLRMPRNDSAVNALELDYISAEYILTFNESKLEVTVGGSETPLESGKTLTLGASSMTIKQTGSSTTSDTDYSGTVVFNVKIKSELDKDDPIFTFEKVGTSLSMAPDWTTELDKKWDFTVQFSVTKKAESASFSESLAMAEITKGGVRAGRFDPVGDKAANIYVQNRPSGSAFDIDVCKFLTAVGEIRTTLSVNTINSNVFSRLPSSVNLEFKGIAPSSQSTVCAVMNIAVKNIDGDDLGEFTVNVYLIDAIQEFATNTDEETVNYGKTGYASNGIKLEDTYVRASKVLDTEFSSSESYDTINLYFGTSVNESAMLDPREDGTNIIFYYMYKDEATDEDKECGVYRFDTSSHTLYPYGDIYELSYNRNVDFSRVVAEFIMRDNVFILDSTSNATVRIKFERNADGVALYKSADSAFRPSDRIEDKNGFEHIVSVGDPVGLKTSALVNIYDEKEKKDTNVVAGERTIAVSRVYMDLSKFGSSVSGDKDTAGYYMARFNAPTDVEQGNEKPYTITITYSGGTKILTLKVQNFARKVNTIELYDSYDNAQKGEDTGKITTASALEFGKFIGGSGALSHKIYIKVVYDKASENQKYFESVNIKLPASFNVSGASITGTEGSYVLVRPESDLNGDNVYIVECTIELVRTAIPGEYTISIYKAINSTNAIEQPITVDVGLQSVTLAVDGKDVTATTATEKTIAYEFELNDSSNNKTTDISVALTSLSGLIAYNTASDNLSVSITGFDGKLDVTDNTRGATPVINVATLSKVGDHTFSIVFTDTTGGVSSNNQFRFAVRITVKMDIFKLEFADGGDYIIETTGVGSDTQTKTVDIEYNDGEANYAPHIDYKNAVNICVVDKSGTAEKILGEGDDLYVHNGMLYVKNSVVSGTEYYVRVTYTAKNGKTITTPDKHISIVTKAHTAEIDKSVGNLEVSGGEATLITKDGTAKLAVVVINNGTQNAVIGKTVNYKLYSNPDRTAEYGSDVMTIDGNGNIVIKKPDVSGDIYYRASYCDDGSTDVQNIDVHIKYYIVPDTVVLDGLDASIYNADGRNISLYIGNGKYTALDLASLIKATNSKFTTLEFSGVITKSISPKNLPTDPAAEISGTIVTPKKAGNVEFDVTVSCQGVAVDSAASYGVTVTDISAITLEHSSGSIDILTSGGSATIAVTENALNGMAVSYTVSETGGLSVTGDGNVKTVTISDYDAIEIKSYKLNVTAIYTSVVTGGYLTMPSGAITISAEYTLDIVCSYSPTFDLTLNGTAVSENASHLIVSGGTYAVKIGNKPENASVTYTAKVSNAVVSIGAFESGVATVSVADTASGEFTITVTPVVYGKSVASNAVEKTYTFTYGADPTVALYVSQNGGAYAELDTSVATNIDFASNSGKTKVKYEISGVDSSLDASNVHVVAIGVAESNIGSVIKSNGKFYVEIIVDADTTLTVGCYIEIGGRTVYLSSYTAEFVSTKPVFEFDGVAETLLPGGETVLAVKNTDGKNTSFTAKYEIVSGEAFVEFDEASGKITANDNGGDKLVVVRATITVSGGVHAGKTYTIEKSLTVYAVQKPSISWNTTKTSLDAGGSVTFDTTDYTVERNIAYGGGTYTFELGTPEITVIGVGGDLAVTDYSVVGNTLNVNSKSEFKGAKLTVKITARITSDLFKGETVSDTVVITVRPQVKVQGAQITNGIGTYDLSHAFVPYAEGNYSVTNLELMQSVTGVAVQGTNIVVSQNITSVDKFGVKATLVMTSGEYAGEELTCECNIVVGKIIISDQEVAFSSGAYNKVTFNDIYQGATQGIYTVAQSSISVKNADDADAVTVIGNNTGSVSIQVAPTANVNGAADRHITLACITTTTSGYTLYNEFRLLIDPVTANIVLKNGESDVSSSDTISVLANGSFVIDLSEDNSLPIKITDVSVKVGDNATSYLTEKHSDNSIMFTAADISSPVNNIAVTVTVNISGTSITVDKTFGATVTVPESAGSYTVSNRQNTSFGINDSRNTVTSSWTINSSSSYTFGYYIAVKSPDSNNVSKYLSKIEILNNSGNVISGATASGTSLNATTVYVYFATSTSGWGGTSHSHSTSYSSGFKLRLTFNTAASLDLCELNVTYRAYNSGNGGYYQDVSTAYSMRVIDKVTIKLDYNGGSSEGYATEITESYKGAFANLTTPKRVGYKFIGWYASATSTSGTKYENGVTVSFASTVTLYAAWERAQCIVTFDANGGTLDSYSASKTVDCGGKLGALPTPIRNGYRFVAWHSVSDESQFEDGNKVTSNTDIAADLTSLALYAEWAVIDYEITLVPGDGATYKGGWTAGSKATADVENGFTVPTAVQIEKSGYVFIGWYTAENGNGVKIENGGYKELASVYGMLYACWEAEVVVPVTYTVTLDANGGAIGGKSALEFTVVSGESFSLHLNIAPTRDNYKFDGWSKTEAFVVDGNITVTAQWKAVYTVKFVIDYNDGTENTVVTTRTYTEGDAYGELPAVSEIEGYTLSKDWQTEGGDVVTSETLISGNVTVYMHATKIVDTTESGSGETDSAQD